MRILMLLLCFVLSSISAALGADDATQTPEDAFRRFMLAMVQNDADKIKAAILPADGADVLWQGSPPPPEVQQQIEKSIQAAKFTRIKEGEKVRLPDGKEFTVEKGMIGDKKILVWVEMDNQRMPAPFWIEQKEDVWKIDATPLITARKAAFKAMQPGDK